MTSFLQLHLLTAYPPANLNRDDNGQPKTAVFGGVQRLRVSSQSLKRAWRTSEIFQQAFEKTLASRTQKIGRLVCDVLTSKGIDGQRAVAISRTVAGLAGKPVTDSQKDQTFTGQLVFFSPTEIEKFKSFAERVSENPKLADELAASRGDVENDAGEEGDEQEETKGNKRKKKGLSKKRIGELRAELLLTSDSAVDLAMFGRMLADSPQYNVEAAVQVAHAISTHRVTIEDDYYVAVDDLMSREDAGTSFIGVQEFAAGLFYIYVCADLNLLLRNLKGDSGLARSAVAALIEAAATVAPRGKQASFASRARASYVLAEAGPDQPRTLATAFLKPVTGDDLAAESVKCLTDFRKRLAAAYGYGNTVAKSMDITGDTADGKLADIIAFAEDAVPRGPE